jgi:signal transduction histidine kinase
LFQNLIDNAARVVTPTGGSVRVELDHSDPSVWGIAIKDDGPGIDPKHHDTIFRPLQTVAGTESETGTGMGLPICKKIANRHNGTLKIHSVLGEGTTITVQLPKESSHEG